MARPIGGRYSVDMVARGRILAIATMLCAALFVNGALAKASHDTKYTYQQTFGSALRLLKVDLGHEVTELNPEWGYILFVYVDSESGKRKNRGAITFVKGETEVTVSVEIPEMPSYHEELLLQKLKRKLRKEHGEAPRPVKKKKKKKKDDEDEDEDEGKDDEDEDDSKKKKKKKKRKKKSG